ncbi:MAG: quinol:electron acceptor oxidoreductase subunit ActD [Pirellulaceae bacterium]
MIAHEPPPTDPSQVLRGILAEFTDPQTLVSAARSVREAGLKRWDSHSPFPVHGIDGAMGIRPTILPWLVFGAGVTGALVALLMQWWTNAVNYPLNISGKPLFSLPANIPVTFELIILFSALTAFVGVLVLNGLPRFNNPLLEKERFLRVTTDRFFIAIDAGDPEFEARRVRDLLQAAGAIAVEDVHGPRQPVKIPLAIHLTGVVVVCLAMIPPLWIAMDRRTKSDTPRVHPVRDMDFQPKFKPQAATLLFANSQAMRPQVPGTIAYGDLRDDDHFYLGLVGQDFATTFPAQFQKVTMDGMKRGRERFRIYCAPCHGLAGEGDGITSERALARADSPGWVRPLSLHSQGVREQPVGKIFNTITNGIRTMPAYASQIAPGDRWAIIVYVLALQRSQNAILEDLPPNERQQLELRDFKN